MANKKITDLPDIGTPDALDVLEIVDVSTNTSKKVLFSELGGGGGSQSLDEVLAVGNTTDLPAIFESEFSRVTVSPDVNVKVEALGTPFVESTTYNDGSITKSVDANQTALNFQTPTGSGTIQIPDVVDATEIIATREWVVANGSTPPNATETVAGIAEIATTAEVSTGTDDTRIVTPLKLKAVTDLKQNKYFTNNTTVTSVGTTETILFSQLIAANSKIVGDNLFVKSYFEKIGTAGAYLAKFRLSTDGTIANSVIIAISNPTAVNTWYPFIRNMLKFESGNILRTFLSTQNFGNDDAVLNVATSTHTYNLANNYYILVTAQNVNAADTTYLRNIIIQ